SGEGSRPRARPREGPARSPRGSARSPRHRIRAGVGSTLPPSGSAPVLAPPTTPSPASRWPPCPIGQPLLRLAGPVGAPHDRDQLAAATDVHALCWRETHSAPFGGQNVE